MVPRVPDVPGHEGRKRILRFRLRTFLALVTLICLWLGYHVRETRLQAQAVRAVLAVPPSISAPHVDYRHQFGIEPIWPEWLLRLFGKDFLLRAVAVSFDGANASDADLKSLVNLSHLRQLDLEYTAVSDDGLAFISAHFPKLTRLDLQETRITASGLRHLARLSSLRDLLFGKCEITDEDLAHLEPLDELEHLTLRRTKIRGEGLEYLVGLCNLRSLDLDRTPLTDAAVGPLSQMSQLDELTLSGTGLSGQSIDELKSALPKCKIVTEKR